VYRLHCPLDHFQVTSDHAVGTATAVGTWAIAVAVKGGLADGHHVPRHVIMIIVTSVVFACTPSLLAWLSANVMGTTGATLVIPLGISCGRSVFDRLLGHELTHG
jgi:hypothetical protein